MRVFLKEQNGEGLKNSQMVEALRASLEGRRLRRALIIPPDYTRFHSNAGFLANAYYHMLADMGCEADILPALGTHDPVTKAQCAEMLGVPFEKVIAHNWRTDVVKLGEVPGDYLSLLTDGLWREPIDVEINRLVMDERYDIVLSLGQVVPHEVIGMANHSKNLFVGVGGSDMINKSHMVGAVYGMERMMGKDHTPVRRMFDYCLEKFLKDRPILFVMTVTTAPGGNIHTHGLFIGDGRDALEEAVALSQQKNITFVDRPIKKCVVYLDPKEFKSTWLGNKAVYRTRMAVADDGDLIVLAPGVTKFGEDEQVDGLIRKYGYCGTPRVMEHFRNNDDLRQNMGAAAHLIHGSSEGRFRITYAVKSISRQEIAGAGFIPADCDEVTKRYNPKALRDGWNILPDGEEVYFIPNPALGLWIDRTRFK